VVKNYGGWGCMGGGGWGLLPWSKGAGPQFVVGFIKATMLGPASGGEGKNGGMKKK